MAELRKASVVWRRVLYSGANVAQTSAAHEDQPRMNRYTNTSLVPPHGPGNVACTLRECQSPVKYGTAMNTNSASVSSPPVRYVRLFIGRIPKMLNAQTPTMQPIAIACGSPKYTLPIVNQSWVAVGAWAGNHRATTRSPMILPKIASTTDQPIQ